MTRTPRDGLQISRRLLEYGLDEERSGGTEPTTATIGGSSLQSPSLVGTQGREKVEVHFN